MENCRRVSGPSFCDDVRVDRGLKLGFLACDPSLRYGNYAANVFNQSSIRESGALWVYDLNKPESSAGKLVLQGFDGPFHPTGLSIAPTTENSTSARTVLLVVNRVPFETPRVEVLYYYPARQNLVYKKTISSQHFHAAHKVLAFSSPFVHRTDDTPSFIVANDHGFNISHWMRNYEEKFNLPAATLAFYNARANETREMAWRLQMPSALVESQEPDSVWMAQAKGGVVGLYKTHMSSGGRQESRVSSVDTDEPMTVTWPGWRVNEAHPQPLKDVVIDPQETPSRYRMQYFHEPVISHDGSEFGSPSAISFVPAESLEHRAERVLVTGQYERGFLECILE
ncbi:hypothetical protein BGZ70_005544 [Mortierella alpina]|uniref:Uncharacterized protein n=1 Tax=Mortierella alpina TaxID=64518 RepID=A0A9P6M4F7_MORAP|nr:hypothetical protein BGZ70_005544 [Mortierella alpina]